MNVDVVVPSFNQCRFLRLTLQSILADRAQAVAAVVVDGGSTDGSVELLRSISDPRLSWTSEADRGQSDAINKGMARATGDVVTWLNSDDLYVPGALPAVAEAFERNPAAQWVIGRVEIIDEHGKVIRPAVTRYKNRRLDRYSYRSLLRENYVSQMGVFWRRDFGERVAYPGGKLLDESLHYTMDYDLWLRMGRAAEPVILDRVVAQFRLYRGSKSGAVKREQFDEQYRVASRYFAGDTASRLIHRFNVEKVVWAYRVLRLLGR